MSKNSYLSVIQRIKLCIRSSIREKSCHHREILVEGEYVNGTGFSSVVVGLVVVGRLHLALIDKKQAESLGAGSCWRGMPSLC